MSVPNQPRGISALTIPTGVELGAYSKYEDAQRAVDYLSDHDFPVKKVSIVGEDLRMVERITGRLDYGRVAASGAATGAWFGVMMALVMWIVVGGFGLVDFLVPVVVGAAFGILLGVGSYALRPKTRDFTSASTVVAQRYVVIADPSVATGMQEALAKEGLGGAHRAPVARPVGGPVGAPVGGPVGDPAAGAAGVDPAGVDPASGAAGGHEGQDGPGAVDEQRPTATGFAPATDGTPRYGARLEDLAPDQRAHGEAQLRQADAHRRRPTEPLGEQRAAEG